MTGCSWHSKNSYLQVTVFLLSNVFSSWIPFISFCVESFCNCQEADVWLAYQIAWWQRDFRHSTGITGRVLSCSWLQGGTLMLKWLFFLDHLLIVSLGMNLFLGVKKFRISGFLVLRKPQMPSACLRSVCQCLLAGTEDQVLKKYNHPGNREEFSQKLPHSFRKETYI